MPAFFSSLLVLVCLHVFIWFLVALVDASTVSLIFFPQFSFNAVLLVLAAISTSKITPWTPVFHWLLMTACILVCVPSVYPTRSCVTQLACNLQNGAVVLTIITLVLLFLFWCYSMGISFIEKKSIQKNQFDSIQFKVATGFEYLSIAAFTFLCISIAYELTTTSSVNSFNSALILVAFYITYIAVYGVLTLSLSMYCLIEGFLFYSSLFALLNFFISLPLFVVLVRFTSNSISTTSLGALGLLTFLQLLTAFTTALAAYQSKASPAPRHSPAEEEERRSVV
jgi:hypothetical protein